jgi:hypothetical protein
LASGISKNSIWGSAAEAGNTPQKRAATAAELSNRAFITFKTPGASPH